MKVESAPLGASPPLADLARLRRLCDDINGQSFAEPLSEPSDSDLQCVDEFDVLSESDSVRSLKAIGSVLQFVAVAATFESSDAKVPGSALYRLSATREFPKRSDNPRLTEVQARLVVEVLDRCGTSLRGRALAVGRSIEPILQLVYSLQAEVATRSQVIAVLSLVAEAAPPSGTQPHGRQRADAPPLEGFTKDELPILHRLAGSPRRRFLPVELRREGGLRSEKPIRGVLRRGHDCGLVDYPPKRRKGAQATQLLVDALK